MAIVECPRNCATFIANHKRVVRLMRLDNLLALRRSAFVATTDSDHELLVHLNLASRMQLNGINQLWVADIPSSDCSRNLYIWQ